MLVARRGKPHTRTMAKHVILWLTTAAVFLATSTTAVPVIDDDYQSDEPRPVTQCAVTCPDTSSAKFQYTSGQTYEYTYESDIKTTVAGASEHSSLHMRATVLLDVVSACEMNLRLSDVSLQDSDPTRYETRQTVRDLTQFKKILQEKALSFAFIDGRIESVCPRSDDEIWAVNIRRGILSTLQNSMSRLQGLTKIRETDIAGNCPVKYEVIASSAQTIKIKKTKELLGCTDRQDAQTIFQGMPYSADSDIQSMPLMASTYSCEQEVNTRTRVIVKSSCIETHAFRPFAKWNSGASTEVAYKLTFRRQSNSNQRPDGARRFRSTMLFDHTMTSQQTAETLRETQQTFQTLCQKTQVDIRPDVPALFTKLVSQMKRFDTQTLRQLMTTVKGTSMCAKAEKFYRDALPVLGTTAAVATMRQLIRDSQATEKEIDIWMSAIAFIKNPTKDMLKELKPLLESNMQKAALPVSSLINTYCQLNDNQPSNPDVTQIIKMFEDVLSYNCRVQSDEQVARMLTSLRAIGNAGRGAQSAVATLTRCASNEASPMSVRVAAINAFRRIDCNVDNRGELFKLLENRQADSELRINAYLATMQCATEETIQRVQTVLESDEINQVLSFIWTHLTNLRETASPLKRQIRAILENSELKKEFDMDKRKFSRNIELSTFSELLNVGANVESNLIWSGQSFVPRSASVNLTVDLFGKSINLVEVGGRIQGVEDILERLLGPGSELDNAILGGKRERRAPFRDELLNSIDRSFDKQPDSDQLSYFIRVFGNEIRAGDIFAFDLESFKSKFNFLDWLIELAKDHNIDVTRSFQFLDANFVIPTGSGFPIRLNAVGSATIGLSAKGKVDVRQMLSSPSTFDVNGSVKPSAALEVRASMGVDAQVASTGLKIVNTLHSSTVLDGVVQLRNGRVFNLDWNLPQDKVEIFNAESHIYVVHRDQEREQRTPEGKSFDWKRCTNSDMAEKTGLEICGELTVPKVGAGALGAAVARIYVNKLDTYKGFHFDASYVKSTTDNTDTVRVSFNTPGSRVDRELTTIFSLNKPQRQFNMNIKSPWKRINVDGLCVSTPELKKYSLKAMLDETTEYSISTELGIARTNDGQETRYTPKLKIVVPEKPNILLDGFINITPKKYDVKLALKNAFSVPVTTDGWIQIVDKRSSVKYDVSMQIGAPFFRGNLTGYTSQTIENSLKTWASRAVLQYTYRGGAREQIVVNHKIRDQSVNSLKTYSTDCSWTSTLWPRYNGQAGLELSYSANSVRTKVEVGFDDTRKLSIITSGAHDFHGKDKKFNGLVKLTLPYKDWNYEMKVDHINNWDMLQTNATVKSGPPGSNQKAVTVDVGLRKEGDHPLSVNGEAHIKFPGREISITESLVERAPREYYNVAVVQWQRGADVRIESTYKMQPRHEMTHTIRSAGLEQPITISGHVLPNPKNAQGRIQLVHAGKTYMAEGTWTFHGTSNQFNARVRGEVSVAGRGMSVTSEVTRRDQEFGGSTEIVYGDQRYAVSSQVTAVMSAPKFQTRFEWPGQQFLELTGNGKYEQQGWNTTPRDVEGSLRLTSSIDSARQMSISFAHDKNPNGFKTNGELTWAANKKITGELNVDKTKATVALTTPFAGYTTVRGETSYTVRDVSGTINGKISWDGNRQIVLMITGDANQPGKLVTGKITLTTPFRGLESLASNLRYNVVADKHSANADFSWARGRQVAVAITMNHQLNGWYLTNSGEMTVTTPFSGMQNGRLRWQHQNTADSWRCKHDAEIDGRKYSVELDTSNRLTGTTRRVSGRAGFQCPVLADWLQNASFSFDYQHDTRALKSVGKSEANYGRNKFTYEHDFNIDPSNAIVIKAKITTPFAEAPELGFGFNNRRQGNGWTSNNELVMGSHGRIGLDGSYQQSGYAVDATITLTTPYRRLERIAANLKNQQQRDGAWAAHADLLYAANKQIVIDGKLGLQSPQKVIELEIKSPCPRLRQARIAAGYSGTARNFQASIELSHNALGRDKITATVSASTADLQNMNMQITVKTPFADFSSFKVVGRHLRDSEEHTASTATWELNSYRGSALVDMKARSLVDFDARYELEYTTGRKLELATSFKVDPKVVFTATFKSPFDAAKMVTANFNQEGPLDNFRMTSELAINRNSRYTSGLEFTLRRDSIRTSFRLTTPHRSVASVAAAFNVAGQLSKFTEESSFELNGQKWTRTMSFEVTSTPMMKLSGKVEMPSGSVRSITYTVNHNGPVTAFVNNLSIIVDGATTTASSEFRLDGPSIKFELKTPYQPLTQVSVAHTTKLTGRSFAGWQNNAVLQFNGQQYTGESSMGWRGKELQVVASVKIPQEYSVTLSHKGDNPTNFDTSIILRLADRQIKETIGLKSTQALTDFKYNVETNYPGYERWEATFKQENAPNGFKVTLGLTTPLREVPRVTAELTQRYTSKTDFTTTMKLQLPIESASQITATLVHRGTPQDLSSTVSIKINDQTPLTGSVTFKNTPRATEGSLAVTTPFEQLSKFNGQFRLNGQDSMNFVLTGNLDYTSSVLPAQATPLATRLEHSASTRTQFKTIAELTIPAGKHSATLEHNGDPTNFLSSMRVVMPSYGTRSSRPETYEATLEHSLQGDKPRTALTIRGPSQFQLTATKVGTGSNLQLNAEVRTPFEGFSRTAASYSHRFEWPTIVEIRGNIETAQPGWERMSAVITHSGANLKNFRSSASIETSRAGYQRMGVTVSNAFDRTGGVKTSASIETSFPGYTKFAVNSDLSRKSTGWRWTSTAETPLSGYERWSASVEHATTATGLRTSVQVSTPITNYRTFGTIVTYNSEEAAQFQTTVQVTTPCPRLPQIEVTLTHRGATVNDFTTGLNVNYGNGKKIETLLSYKAATDSTSYDGRAMLSTNDCSYFQDFTVSASHNRKTDVKSGSFAVTLNGEKKVDFDYSYSTSGDRNININIRSPQSIKTDVNVGGNGQGTAVVSWNDQKIQFDFGLKNTLTSTLTDRYATFRVTVPKYRRTVGFGAGYTVATDRIASRGELYWDTDAEPEFKYEIEGSTKMTGRTISGYDGRFKVVSGLFNTDSSFSHKISAGGRRLKTDITLDASERLMIRSDLNMASANGLTHTIVVQHPRFSKDVTMTTEATPSGFKTTLTYEQQTWTLEGTLNDLSSDNGPKYTSSLRLANPNSMFDIQLVGDYATMLNEGTTAGGMAFKYFMSGDRQMKTLVAMKAEINRLRKEISWSMETPIDVVRFSTTNREVDLDSGIIRYDVNFECSRMFWRSVLDISRPDRSIGIKIYSAPEDFVEAFAQAVSPTQMMLELAHTTSGSRINDVQLSASYTDDEHLLIGRSFVRPDLPNDIRSYLDRLKSRRASIKSQMKSDVEAFSTLMQNDGRMKMRTFQQAIIAPITKIALYISDEVNAKVDQVTAAYEKMYRDNEFFVRDISQAMKNHYESISRKLAIKTADLRRMYAVWSESVSDQMDAIKDDFARLNAKTQRAAAAYWTGVAERWEQTKPDLEKIRPFIDGLIEKTKIKLMEFFDNLRQSESFRNFADRLATMQPNSYILPPSQWQGKLEEFADKVDRWLQELLSKPEVHYVRDWLVRSLQDSNWLYKLLGLEQQFNDFVAQLRSMSVETMKMKVREFANTYLQIEKTKWTAWDTQRGEYAFQIYIPFELPDISALRRFDPRPLISQTKAWVVRQLPDEDTSLIDIAYAYKLPSDIREWVPPFKSYASLTGAQHYMTFDRRFFEFAGECSYLLARDFIGGTFSVIVNYDRAINNKPTKKSLTIVTAGRQIEVYPDSKVTVDGLRVEMPVRVGNATVLRRGNLISIIDDWRGLDITCDLPHDHCMLAVSGWYYGKTAGLFGTYDNEPSNDFTQSDKTLTTKPETNAESWTIGQRCRPINRAVVVQPDTTTRRYRACAEVFGDARSSLFRPCFKTVDPAPFLKMCLNDAPTGDNSLEAEKDVCRTAAAYVHECRRREVHLRMPKQCVRCEVPTTNKVFYELEQITLDNESDIPRAADVVFVIQHAACNREVLDKIAGVADGIEKAMKAEGLTSTRFAVVGYGGKRHMSSAHVHTMDGQIFANSAKKLSLALDNYDTESGTDVDAMVALSYAARLPFRAGASKSVVLIGCDACREATIRYSDIQRILLNNDIHLHVLVQETIRLKSKSPKTAYIYGTDQQTVYTRKDVAGDELAGEPDLRRYIRLPKDLCVALTMDTDGSVFSVRQWLDSRPLIQKQFVDVMVRTLARKAQPTECQVCECLADEAQVGVSQCRSCYRRDPFFWLPPNFEEDDSDSESTTPAAPVMVTDNNSKNVVTARPQLIASSRRPIPVRPTRRPITPPNRPGVTRRPLPTRAPVRPRVPPRQQ